MREGAYFRHAAGNGAFAGGDGFDTVDYSAAGGPAEIDLGAGFAALTPAPGAEGPPKVMPLGASLTYGQLASTSKASDGGYRTVLWDLTQAAGTPIDLVGSRSDGSGTLPDPDHEGNPGKTIDWTAEQARGFLDASPADAVLVIVGTNDAFTRDSAADMTRQLGDLIDAVTQHPSSPTLFLGTLPPIDPAVNRAVTVQKALDYNASMPALVAEKQAAGRDVVLVDLASRLTVDDITDPPADRGIHANAQGYQKIGQAWYEALAQSGLLDRTPSRDTLDGIEDVLGTAFGDAIRGSSAANLIYGRQGEDAILAADGDDTVFGGQGVDAVYGNLGADVIYGNLQGDALFGGQGDDLLFGGQEDDVLAGGGGDDVLVGGLGADRFVVGAGQGSDTVTDLRFEQGDRLLLGDQGWTASAGPGGNAVLALSGGGSVTLLGVAPQEVSDAWLA